MKFKTSEQPILMNKKSDKMLRVVCSMTTMPNQYEKVIRTLESLHKQTYKLDAIYLSLPKISRRLGTPYSEVGPEIRRLCTVVPCIDHGPITKIEGGLLMENDPNTIIITFDNDMVYPPIMVEELVKHHREYPNSAIGSSGMLLRYKCPMCAITPNENNYLYNISKFPVPKEGRRVDSIYGYPGGLYVRKFFPSKHLLEEQFFKHSLINEATLLNDDIMISGYLSLQNVERRIFPDMPSVDFVMQDGERKRTEAEISIDMDKFFQRMNLAIDTAKSIGMYTTTESVNANETILGKAFIVVFAVLALIVIFYYLLYYVNLDTWMKPSLNSPAMIYSSNL